MMMNDDGSNTFYSIAAFPYGLWRMRMRKSQIVQYSTVGSVRVRGPGTVRMQDLKLGVLHQNVRVRPI
jgi:hypothetical protein